MASWRHQAFERFPEFRTQLQKKKSPYAYWIELWFAFEHAYRNKNRDLFRRILEFADWCIQQPPAETAANDLPSCVYCCFLEHVSRLAASDCSRWEDASWGGSIFHHPHVKKLYENLLEGKK